MYGVFHHIYGHLPRQILFWKVGSKLGSSPLTKHPPCSLRALSPAPSIAALFKSVRVPSNQNKAGGFLHPRTGRVCSVKSIECSQYWLTPHHPTLQSLALRYFREDIFRKRKHVLEEGVIWAKPKENVGFLKMFSLVFFFVTSVDALILLLDTPGGRFPAR